MALRIVRLGSARLPHEGLRVGTVRHPPRGVPAARFAADDWYDVWYPDLAPSAALVKRARAATDERSWVAFTRRYRSEMSRPGPRCTLDLLAALSKQTDLSVGCYCDDERRCHRSVLRELLVERGAKVIGG